MNFNLFSEKGGNVLSVERNDSDSAADGVLWASDLVRKLSPTALRCLAGYDKFTVDVVIMKQDFTNAASPWGVDDACRVDAGKFLALNIPDRRLHLGTVMWYPDRVKTYEYLSAPMALFHELLHLIDIRENLKILLTGGFFEEHGKGLYGQFTAKANGGVLDKRIFPTENKVAEEINKSVGAYLRESGLGPSEKVALLEPIRLVYHPPKASHQDNLALKTGEKPTSYNELIAPKVYREVMTNVLAARVAD